MSKRVLSLILIVLISQFTVFAGKDGTVSADKSDNDNKKPFFYYIVNKKCKTNFVIGYSKRNYNVLEDGLEYEQDLMTLGWDFLWYPFKRQGFLVMTGMNLDLPVRFVRKHGGGKFSEKNFDNGLYVTLNPYVSMGYGIDFKVREVLGVVASVGLNFENAKLRSLIGNEERLRAVNVLGIVNVKYHVNQRYSVLLNLRAAKGLKYWIKDIDTKAEGSSFSLGLGVSYDF